eukprot:484895-Hanusia_phi.AAC.1
MILICGDEGSLKRQYGNSDNVCDCAADAETDGADAGRRNGKRREGGRRRRRRKKKEGWRMREEVDSGTSE